MRVVVIGENTCLGAGLKVHLLRWGRHQIETIRTTKDRWKSERKFRKDLRKISPDILVDLRFSNCSGDRVFQKNEDHSRAQQTYVKDSNLWNYYYWGVDYIVDANEQLVVSLYDQV